MLAACNNAELNTPVGATGDPTEIALLEFARTQGTELGAEDLDRDQMAELEILGPEDDRHATASDLAIDSVAAGKG